MKNGKKRKINVLMSANVDWYKLGSGNKIHDPLIGHPAMKGRRWQIDYGYPSNGYDKMNQAEKEAQKYKLENKKHTV